MHACDQTGLKYSRLSELRRHSSCFHKPVLAIQCSYCGKDIQRKDFLSAHVLRVHEQAVTGISQLYTCTVEYKYLGNALKCSVNIFSISDNKQDEFRLPIRL